MRERVSAAALICLGECRVSVVNWAMKSKYRACLGECLLGQARRVMAFYEVLEVFDGKLNSQQLTVESAVCHLGRCEFSREVGDGTPGVGYPLLQYCTHRSTGSIREDADGGVKLWVCQQANIGECICGGMEGCGSCVSPRQGLVTLGSTLDKVVQWLEDLGTTRHKTVIEVH